jgi:hypothetical protein
MCGGCFSCQESPTPAINHVDNAIVGGLFRQRAQAENERHVRLDTMRALEGVCQRFSNGCVCDQCHLRKQLRTPSHFIICPFCNEGSEMLVRVPEEIVVDDQPGTSGTANAANGNGNVLEQPGTSGTAASGNENLLEQPGPSGLVNLLNYLEGPGANGNSDGRKEKASEPPAKRRRK